MTNEEAPQERGVIACTLLSIVTCGLFAIYWAYAISGDAAGLRRVHALPPSENTPGRTLLLTLLTCGLYWFYAAGEELDDLEQLLGGKPERNNWGLIYLLLCCVGMFPPAFILMQLQLNSLIRGAAAPAVPQRAMRGDVFQTGTDHPALPSVGEPLHERLGEPLPQFHDRGFSDFDSISGPGKSLNELPGNPAGRADDIDWEGRGSSPDTDGSDGGHRR